MSRSIGRTGDVVRDVNIVRAAGGCGDSVRADVPETTARQAKGPSKIGPLTGLRFFAAIAVVFFHFGKGHITRAPGFLVNVATGGAHGVTLFFILSGFVLAYNYANPAKTSGLRKREFWAARFARIYPVYALALVLTLNRIHLFRPYTPGNIWQSFASITMVLSLTQAWDVSKAMFWNFPAWTLSAEAFFYLVFPWACAAVCKLKPARIVHVALAVWLLNVGMGVIYLLMKSANREAAAFLNSVMGVWPPLRLPEFLLGLLLGRLYLVRPQLRIERRDAVAALALLLITVVVGLGPSNPFTISLLEPPFALLIYALASGRGFLGAFLSLPILILLGDASYAIYILQVPVMKASFTIFGDYGATFLIGAAALIALSVVSYLHFETPARRWIRARLA